MGGRRATTWLGSCLAAAALAATLAAGEAAAFERQIAGVLETATIRIGGGETAVEGITFQARIDTGATLSSINTIKREVFDRDGRDWVRFTVENETGATRELTLPVERTVRIRQASCAEVEERPIVILPLCVGGVWRETEVTLSDRTKLRYPMLVGRSYLGRDFLVDPSGENLVERRCDAVDDVGPE